MEPQKALDNNSDLQKEKLKNNPIHNCFKENKIPSNKFNQGCKRPVLRKIVRH